MAHVPRASPPLLAVAFAVALLAGAGPGAAQTQTCQVTISLPGTQTSGYVISAPGIYCLVTDVNMAASLSGAVIEIQASNVVLDLNGHRIGGGAAGTGTGKYRDNLTSGVTTPFTGGHRRRRKQLACQVAPARSRLTRSPLPIRSGR